MMGRNLPPGVSDGDPNAPWNRPTWGDLLPLVCDMCSFYAETLEEMEEHEHDKTEFRRPMPDPDPHADPDPPDDRPNPTVEDHAERLQESYEREHDDE